MWNESGSLPVMGATFCLMGISPQVVRVFEKNTIFVLEIHFIPPLYVF